MPPHLWRNTLAGAWVEFAYSYGDEKRIAIAICKSNRTFCGLQIYTEPKFGYQTDSTHKNISLPNQLELS